MKIKRYQQPKKQQSYFSITILPWVICIIAALFYCYDFLLRVAPSVMIHDLMAAYHVGATEIGFLSAFYYYAYTPLQIPAGLLLDRYRPRIVLTIAVVLCVIGTYISALVPNLFVGFLGRFLMGFGSAFAFVGTLKLGALWLSHEKFGFFAGLATGLGTLGAMTADIVLSKFVIDFGWQNALYISAAFGIVITLLVVVFVHGQNPKHKVIPQEAKTWSHAWTQLVLIVKSGRFWITGIVGAIAFLPITAFASLWGVAFNIYGYDLSHHTAASSISLIFLGTAFGGPVAGYVSDRLKRRKLPLQVGMALMATITIIILYCTFIPDIVLFILLFLLGFAVGTQILVFAIAKEICPPRATGTATAACNFIVTMGAAIFQPLIGYIIDMVWIGNMTDGIPAFTVHDYQIGLAIVPITLIIGVIMSIYIPETHGRHLP